MAKGSRLAVSVCTILIVVSSALAVPTTHWSLYKKTFGKTYNDAAEESMRREIFAKNKARVDYFNSYESQDAGYTMGLNHLSDWTDEEYSKINGVKINPNAERPVNSLEAQALVDEILNDDSPLPDQVDWRKVPGRVTPVKNQYGCGSCWAFATTGLLEGQEKSGRANVTKSLSGDVDPLSEQDLVDCSKANEGCKGGFMSDALKDIHTMGGIEDEKAYPYQAEDGKCLFKKNKVVMTDTGFAILPEGDENALKKAVARYGPVAVAVYASENMQQYQRGILNDRECIAHTDLYANHGVLVVGYGTDENKQDYWLVKNSWGQNWGMDGYLKMSRNKKNQCLIASRCILATFK